MIAKGAGKGAHRSAGKTKEQNTTVKETEKVPSMPKKSIVEKKAPSVPKESNVAKKATVTPKVAKKAAVTPKESTAGRKAASTPKEGSVEKKAASTPKEGSVEKKAALMPKKANTGKKATPSVHKETTKVASVAKKASKDATKLVSVSNEAASVSNKTVAAGKATVAVKATMDRAPGKVAAHVKFNAKGESSPALAPPRADDLIIPAQQDCFWFESLAELEKSAAKSPATKCDEDDDSGARTRANLLLTSARNAFEMKQSNSRDADTSVLRGILAKGTMEDQIGALAVSLQEAPVHLAEFSLMKLMAIAKKKSREHSWLALEALRDVFGGCLLPDGRRLRAWSTPAWNAIKPHLNQSQRDQYMVYRLHESDLKQYYSELLSILEMSTVDPVDWYRIKSLGMIQELLCLKPEGEVRLLSVLINKVGDPVRKVSARAQRLIAATFEAHPSMKPVIVEEMERLLLRPNVSPRTQYQTVVLLSQIKFASSEGLLARKLVDLYLAVFSQKDLGADSRLLSALLTGLNRSFPFAADLMGDEAYDKQTDRLFKLSRSTNFNAAIQAMMLLFQVINARQSLSTRFYTSLYESMLSPSLLTSSKHSLYLNLVYRTMKSDMSIPRVMAFAKRLLQVCLHSRPGFICGALVLLSEVAKVHPALYTFIAQPPALNDDEEEHFVDVEEDEQDGNKTESPSSSLPGYDPTKRDPQYSRADATCLWELTVLGSHHHPSVAMFAKSLLDSQPISYQGNPIHDFTTGHFLDRFVYRNPKKVEGARGKSVMAPKCAKGLHEAPANTQAFWDKDESKVRDDEKFMHKYFRLRVARGELESSTGDAVVRQCRDDDDEGEDDEDEVDKFADELFENELVKMDGEVDIDVDDDDEFGDEVADEELDDDDGDDDALLSESQLGRVFNDDDDDDDFDGEMMMVGGNDDSDIADDEDEEGKPADGKKKKKVSRFVDAADFAELLELGQDAAKANAKTDKWQGNKCKRGRAPPSASKNKRRKH